MQNEEKSDYFSFVLYSAFIILHLFLCVLCVLRGSSLSRQKKTAARGPRLMILHSPGTRALGGLGTFAGADCVEALGQTASAARRLILVDRVLGRDFVQPGGGLGHFGFRLLHIAARQRSGKDLELILQQFLAKTVAGSGFDVLTDALFSGQRMGHGSMLLRENRVLRGRMVGNGGEMSKGKGETQNDECRMQNEGKETGIFDFILHSAF